MILGGVAHIMITDSYAVQWTYEAMLCYQISSNCTKCPNSNLESKCQMKHTIAVLLQKLGAPKHIRKVWRKKDDNTSYRISTGLLPEEREMLQQEMFKLPHLSYWF